MSLAERVNQATQKAIEQGEISTWRRPQAVVVDGLADFKARVHDALFERYDEGALTADDLALFPDYLVCIPAAHNDAPENAGLIDMLSAGLPVKVLVEQTDLLEEASIGTGHFAFGVRSARLATTAQAASTSSAPPCRYRSSPLVAGASSATECP